METASVLQSAFSVDGLFGHASYILLIASMLMTQMTWLRLLAIASGVLSIVYSLMIADYVSAGWEILFVAVNVGQLGWQAWRNRMSRFDADERAFREAVVPELDAAQVRKLLRTGQWRTAAVGEQLIGQGQMVSHLLFLVQGEVSVVVDGAPVGRCGPGALLGEMSVLTDLPATASITVLQSTRYLALERQALRRLMGREADIEQAIDRCYRQDLRRKLAAANQALAQQIAG